MKDPHYIISNQLPAGVKETVLGNGRFTFMKNWKWGDAPDGYPTLYFLLKNPCLLDNDLTDSQIFPCYQVALPLGFLKLSLCYLFPEKCNYEDFESAPHSQILSPLLLMKRNQGKIILSYGNISNSVNRIKIYANYMINRLINSCDSGLYVLGFDNEGYPLEPEIDKKYNCLERFHDNRK